MARGDICLATFPYAGTVGAKVRPVLLLTDEIGSAHEILAAYMSAAIPATLLPTDILIDPTLPDFASTNLKSTTVLRLHKLATIHHSDIVRHLGTASPTLWAEAETKLRLLLNL
jgi:mRNA interferase MazF